MLIKSYKTHILLFYILFMFVNSIVPIFSIKGIWKYADIFHFIEFFILGYLSINATIDNKLDIKKILILFCILTLIPIIDEGLQYFIDIPGRIADINDLIIDIAGEYSGVFFFILIHKLRKYNG